MAAITTTGTLTAGNSRAFDLAPGSALTLTLLPNCRVTVTETPETVSASDAGGNSPRTHNHQLAGVVTYGPYAMGGSVVVENASNSGSTVTWGRKDTAVTTDSTGTSLVSADGNVIPLPQFVQPRIVKQFSDLLDVTIATSNATVVSSIDTASPFGCPALKLVITFSTTAGRVEVSPPALNIPSWNGHLGYTMWIDDATKLGESSVFVGTSGYALYSQAKRIGFNGGNLAAGPSVVYAGPCRQTSVTDGGFVFGTSSLIDHKLRFTSPNPIAGTCTVWVKDCFIANPQRPVVVFSMDDGFDSWITAAGVLTQYGMRGTFGVNSNQIDNGTGITSANLRALIAAGHHVSSHNVRNYKLQTLYGTGLGKNNGTNTSQTATEYATDFHTGRKALEALGADPQDFMYHPWVQGGVDQIGLESLWNAGVEMARGTDPYEAQIYGMPLYNNAMNMRAVELGNTRTLAQAKAQADLAVTHGGLCWFMAHTFAATAADSVTWATADWAALVAYVASLDVDVLTVRQLRDRLNAFGLLPTRKAPVNSNAMPVRMIGRLIGANMNVTTDQAITLMAGSWKIEGVYVTTPSVSLTTAAGGFYTAAAKGGTAIVSAGQVYSTLTAATDVLGCTMAATPTITNNTMYLSLTTGQGSAATADVFVFGRPA